MDNGERIPKKMLASFKKAYPELYDNDFTIIAPPPPQPSDRLYKLEYSPNTRYLKLNKVVIKKFQFGKRNDEVFDELFKQKGWTKLIKLTGKDRASQIIKVIGLPRSLSNAIFDSGDNEKTLIVHTVITRERANDFNLNYPEIKDYIVKMRDKHYSLLDAEKRK